MFFFFTSSHLGNFAAPFTSVWQCNESVAALQDEIQNNIFRIFMFLYHIILSASKWQYQNAFRYGKKHTHAHAERKIKIKIDIALSKAERSVSLVHCDVGVNIALNLLLVLLR